MRMLLKISAFVLPLGIAAAVVAQQEPEKLVEREPIPVSAIKAEAAPILDGDASDAVWQSAPVAKVSAVKGHNFKDGQGNTEGTVQAAYTEDTLYLLITYDDPTLSMQRSPYQKQADGTWIKLKDPDDKGGDNNKYYEDKFALIWNIDDSMTGFEQFGCASACHAGETGKPYGNKYTDEEGETGDIWHMKYVRTGNFGQVDDQFLDHTRYDAEKTPEAGRKSDAKDGGGYADIKLVDGKPEFMSKDAKPANNGGTYWLMADDQAPFDDSKFVAGDEVASIMVAPFAGDRGDISLGIQWKDGRWVAEVARKLVTGSETDVQFEDLSAPHYFGISYFDNAQVRHAYVLEALELTFAQ